MSEQEQIEKVLSGLEHPSFVTEIRHALGEDWSGDPAVWVWVILRDDVANGVEISKHTQPVRSMIVQALRAAGIHRWPYLRFRSQTEQAELDKAEAA